MDDLQKKRRDALFAVGLWVAQAAYVLFPFDLVPDFLPVIGWLDDLVALFGLAATTVWMGRLLWEAGLDSLIAGSSSPSLEVEPYEPIPPDVLRSM